MGGTSAAAFASCISGAGAPLGGEASGSGACGKREREEEVGGAGTCCRGLHWGQCWRLYVLLMLLLLLLLWVWLCWLLARVSDRKRLAIWLSADSSWELPAAAAACVAALAARLLFSCAGFWKAVTGRLSPCCRNLDAVANCTASRPHFKPGPQPALHPPSLLQSTTHYLHSATC